MAKLKTKRITLLGTLGMLALMIWGLYELAHMPYRPPHDMTTLLGRPELQIVWSLIVLFTATWVGFFGWFVFTFVYEKT